MGDSTCELTQCLHSFGMRRADLSLLAGGDFGTDSCFQFMVDGAQPCFGFTQHVVRTNAVADVLDDPDGVERRALVPYQGDMHADPDTRAILADQAIFQRVGGNVPAPKRFMA